MEIALSIVLILSLVLTFVQDYKGRAVSILIFALLAASALGLFMISQLDWQMVLTNLAFVVLVIGCLFLYIAVKERGFVNIFKSHFGIGDFVFFLAITPLFANRNFILFFITGMLLSAIIHLITARNQKEQTIPLAGYLAIYVLVLKGIEFSTSQTFLYTDIF